MKIPTKPYLFDTFIEELTSIELEPYTRLKVACFLTSFSKWYDEQKRINVETVLKKYGVNIDQLGDIRRITAKYFDTIERKEKIATFYSYLDPTSKALVCFTDERQEAIEQTLENIAETAVGFYYAFITHKVFNVLRKRILDLHPDSKCTYFSATYSPLQSKKSFTRPTVQRTMVYYGMDALETFDEVSEYYGVHPTVMRYDIPDKGIYEIHAKGSFSLWSEEKPSESRSFLLSLSNLALEDILISRGIIESSNYELIPVKTEKRTFEIPKLTPWIIDFSHEVDFQDAESLIEIMSSNGFSIFNEVKEKGSIRLNGMVIDDKKHTLFTLDMDSTKMYVAPIGEVSFDSFYRFYKVITENFDSNAICSRFEV